MNDEHKAGMVLQAACDTVAPPRTTRHVEKQEEWSIDSEDLPTLGAVVHTMVEIASTIRFQTEGALRARYMQSDPTQEELQAMAGTATTMYGSHLFQFTRVGDTSRLETSIVCADPNDVSFFTLIAPLFALDPATRFIGMVTEVENFTGTEEDILNAIKGTDLEHVGDRRQELIDNPEYSEVSVKSMRVRDPSVVFAPTARINDDLPGLSELHEVNSLEVLDDGDWSNRNCMVFVAVDVDTGKMVWGDIPWTVMVDDTPVASMMDCVVDGAPVLIEGGNALSLELNGSETQEDGSKSFSIPGTVGSVHDAHGSMGAFAPTLTLLQAAFNNEDPVEYICSELISAAVSMAVFNGQKSGYLTGDESPTKGQGAAALRDLASRMFVVNDTGHKATHYITTNTPSELPHLDGHAGAWMFEYFPDNVDLVMYNHDGLSPAQQEVGS
jgi:hypothetical protein